MCNYIGVKIAIVEPKESMYTCKYLQVICRFLSCLISAGQLAGQPATRRSGTRRLQVISHTCAHRYRLHELKCVTRRYRYLQPAD